MSDRHVHLIFFFFFFNDTATTEIYTLSLHDALPILLELRAKARRLKRDAASKLGLVVVDYIQLMRSSEGRDNREQEISEIDRKSTRLNSSHLVISYAVFCLKKKNKYKCLELM